MISPYMFFGLATVTVGCAIAVVSARNIFHAGLFLIGTFLGVAGVYASLHNYFLAAAQLLIYSGAIAVLMLFGIMMTQKITAQPGQSHNGFALIAIPAILALLGILVRSVLSLPYVTLIPTAEDVLKGMGQAMMQAYLLPFEIVSVILLVALIGALAIAKDKEEA